MNPAKKSVHHDLTMRSVTLKLEALLAAVNACMEVTMGKLEAWWG